MRIVFHVNYRTQYGEELIVNSVADDSTVAARYKMHTYDGEHWQADVVFDNISRHGVLTYYYSVECDGSPCAVRREWARMPHRVRLTAQRAAVYNVYDQWIDIPDDAYYYSSAFVDCLCRRELKRERVARFQHLLRLKVRAPQLGSNQELALVGNTNELGCWDVNRALRMVERHRGEWVADVDAAAIAGKTVEMKFVVLTVGSGEKSLADGCIWEEGMNRRLLVPQMVQGEVTIMELPAAHFAISNRRVAGTLVPVFSLRSEGSFGVGDFGDLKEMIDFVSSTGQRALQILPINDTTSTHTWTDSYPYSCISIYAIHPQYVNLRQ